MAEINQAYKATIDLRFNYKKNGKSSVRTFDIAPERIQYIVVDYEYECREVLPIIYIGMKLPLDMHDKILDTYKFSTMHLRIQRKNLYSRSSVSKNNINDTFNYVASNTNVNMSPTLTDNGMDDRSYVTTRIGLVSQTMSNKLRETFGGTFNEISTNDIIDDMALKGLGNVIMPKLYYNHQYNTLEIPTLNTRYRLLEYIFRQDAFYDTYFTFFMDFDNKVYLIPKDAKQVTDGGNPTKCIIDITDAVDIKSFDRGNSIVNGAYRLYVNSANSKVDVNEGSDQNINKIIGYSDSIGEQSLYISANQGAGSKNKAEYIRSDNAAVYKNEIANNKVLVHLFKSNIDSSIFTPNKCYAINHISNYRKYNGNYILSYKKESYTPIANKEFTITTEAGFKLITSLEKAQTKTNQATGGYYENPQADTTANQKKSTATTQTANRKTGTNSNDPNSKNSNKKSV